MAYPAHLAIEFQRLYTPTAFREERILWRAVIQLNIVRSIRTILDALNSATSPPASPPNSPRSHHRSLSTRPRPRLPSTISGPSSDNIPRPGPSEHYSNGFTRTDSGNESEPDYDSEPRYSRSTTSSTTLASSPLEALKARLLPLCHVESLLIAKLIPPNEDEATHLAGPSHSGYQSTGSTSQRPCISQEVFVRPGPGWKGALARARVHYPSDSQKSDDGMSTRPTSAGNTGLETADEPQEVLHQCRRDMIQLWADAGVRDILKRKKIRLEEASGL